MIDYTHMDDATPPEPGYYLVCERDGDSPIVLWWRHKERTFAHGGTKRPGRWWYGPLPNAPKRNEGPW